MARPNLKERDQSVVAVRTVGSSPVYSCSIRTSMVNALILVRALDRRTVVVTGAGADVASHAICMTKFGITSHACMFVSIVLHSFMIIGAQAYHCVCR